MDDYDETFRDIRVILRDGTVQPARSSTNHVEWRCVCQLQTTALTVSCKPPYPDTICPSCQRRYKFRPPIDAVAEIDQDDPG